MFRTVFIPRENCRSSFMAFLSCIPISTLKLGLSQRTFNVNYKPLWTDVLDYILRIWWPKIIFNKDLRKVTRQEDINVEIRKRKFRRFGHTLRKEDGEIPNSALFWSPQGNRKRGRPRNGLRSSVNKEAGRSRNELSFLAADRRKWKGLIDNLCS
jgi:hypothetical protein